VDNRKLTALQRLSPTWVFLAALALALLAFLTPGVIGALLLLVMVTALGWLLVRTWPVTTPPARLLRLIVLLGLLVIAYLKIA
jgi:hypothetical protein